MRVFWFVVAAFQFYNFPSPTNPPWVRAVCLVGCCSAASLFFTTQKAPSR